MTRNLNISVQITKFTKKKLVLSSMKCHYEKLISTKMVQTKIKIWKKLLVETVIRHFKTFRVLPECWWLMKNGLYSLTHSPLASLPHLYIIKSNNIKIEWSSFSRKPSSRLGQDIYIIKVCLGSTRKRDVCRGEKLHRVNFYVFPLFYARRADLFTAIDTEIITV